MSGNQKEILAVLTPLTDEKYYRIVPATKEQIQSFKARASEKGVPQSVVDELTDLYMVADNFWYDTVIGFHSCTDEMIFEWWSKKELWLGQRDMDTLRWKDGKWCLGSAGRLSYSEGDECDTLIGLIRRCIKDIDKFNNRN
jgi:hypothetical protein